MYWIFENTYKDPLAKNLFKGRHLNLFRHFMPTIFKNSGKQLEIKKRKKQRENLQILKVDLMDILSSTWCVLPWGLPNFN